MNINDILPLMIAQERLRCAINALVSIVIAPEFGEDPEVIALDALATIEHLDEDGVVDMITPPMDSWGDYDPNIYLTPDDFS